MKRYLVYLTFLLLVSESSLCSHMAYAGGTKSKSAYYEKLARQIISLCHRHMYKTPKSIAMLRPNVTRTLLAKVSRVKSDSAFARVINDHLHSAGLSHTHLFRPSDDEFYLLRAFINPAVAKMWPIWHFGMLVRSYGGKYIVRGVLEGFSAERAGVLRGDVLLEVNGKPFHPRYSFQSSKPSTLLVIRNGKRIAFRVTPVLSSLYEAMKQATRNSIKTWEFLGFRMGYIHLWALGEQSMIRFFQKHFLNLSQNLDGLILDLRGGFGGSTMGYRNFFYKNNRTYYQTTFVRSKVPYRARTFSPEKMGFDSFRAFTGPLVVLIDSSTRSAKEALAFQFRKDGRAKLLGQKTKGALCPTWFYLRDNPRFFLMLPIGELLLDGKTVEGKGVSPDVLLKQPFVGRLSTNEGLLFSSAFLVSELLGLE